MKKTFSNLYKLSFISYALVMYANPYFSAVIWSDSILIVFILSCIYQLIYIIFLRKKDNTSFLKSVANLVLYFTFSVYFYLILFIIDKYFNGIGVNCVLFNGCSEVYYGLKAIKYLFDFNDLYAFMFVIIIIPCLFYQIIYVMVNRKK